MLYNALLLSAALLLAVNLATRRSKAVVLGVSIVGFLLAGYLPLQFWRVIMPVTFLNGFLILLVLPVWYWWGGGTWRMVVLSCLATAAAYGWHLPSRLERHQETQRVKENFPYESLEARVPLLPNNESRPLFSQERLQEWESHLDDGLHTALGFDRSKGLERIHEHSVDNFITSWGNGIQRMPPNTVDRLTNNLRTQPSPMQPEQPTYGTNQRAQDNFLPDDKALSSIHSDGRFDFVNPFGFGYVKDRQHVAGFQSHRFSEVPKSKEVEVLRLELVSLLMHKEPGVYLSDRLPQMDALKGVPTRPLDAFETEGLAALRKGEDLFVREDRMLGSIRSVKQCIACHGGERGQLLGAFTYTMRAAR